MIAMALASKPEVVIADEPTTALDVMTQAQILELLEHLAQRFGLSLLLVTHDLAVVAEICHRVLVMYGGRLAEIASVDSVYNRPLHPYTQLLLAALPDLSRPMKLTGIPGQAPRLDAPPPGCRFAPRCPRALEICHVSVPRVRCFGGSHWAACHLLS